MDEYKVECVKYILRETTARVAYRKYSAASSHQSVSDRQRVYTLSVNKECSNVSWCFWYITACVYWTTLTMLAKRSYDQRETGEFQRRGQRALKKEWNKSDFSKKNIRERVF